MIQNSPAVLLFSKRESGSRLSLFLKIFGAFFGVFGRKIIIFVAKSLEII
jgi:hypothetical protein